MEGGVHRAALLGVVLLALAGCGSTKAAKGTGGAGNGPGGIAQGQCGPGDTTESCCLKTYPGQYERCGAIAPKNPPKDRPGPPLPPLPSPDVQREWNERCEDYYVQCQEGMRAGRWGRKFGESQCQACWDLCRRIGEWPTEANEKPCPEV
jgi:hypothetical protein